MLGNIGPLEIIIVLIIALIVFGPKRLPELGNSLGKGIREFKDSVTGEKEDDDVVEDPDVKTIAASKATTTPVEPSTTHQVEADEAEVVNDKNA
ncbi:MAG: twin-arginine translocase TatA/TatE family subunit [Actinobacteria bacterium]|nr:twin-arginine translocase TatA/TatE family subunit [Actinomycetota bacterium]